jgi:hypothetical protein
VASRVLAFRPPTVVGRLAPASAACPLSLRDLLRAAAPIRVILPVVRAPTPGVARGALVAAQEAGSALGLALPPGGAPEPWFAAVVRAADESAAGIPIFLSGEVAVEGAGEREVERAFHEAWRLVGAGLTHLAVEVGAVPEPERPRVFEEVARVAIERGICVDLVLSSGDSLPSPSAVAIAFAALARAGAPPDLVSVRCPLPASEEEGRGQVRRLVEICAALRGVPVMRRGTISRHLLGALARAPIGACEDGGAAARAAAAVIPEDLLAPAAGPPARTTALERAEAALDRERTDRLEARAYLEVAALVEALGSAGSAAAIAGALEGELDVP